MDQPSEYGIKCEPGMSLNSSCQAYGQDASSEDLTADMDLSNFLDVDEQTLNGEGGLMQRHSVVHWDIQTE